MSSRATDEGRARGPVGDAEESASRHRTELGALIRVCLHCSPAFSPSLLLLTGHNDCTMLPPANTPPTSYFLPSTLAHW